MFEQLILLRENEQLLLSALQKPDPTEWKKALDSLQEIYVNYIALQEVATKLPIDISKKFSELPSSQGQLFDGILILPVQRGPRFQLLFNELGKQMAKLYADEKKRPFDVPPFAAQISDANKAAEGFAAAANIGKGRAQDMQIRKNIHALREEYLKLPNEKNLNAYLGGVFAASEFLSKQELKDEFSNIDSTKFNKKQLSIIEAFNRGLMVQKEELEVQLKSGETLRASNQAIIDDLKAQGKHPDEYKEQTSYVESALKSIRKINVNIAKNDLLFTKCVNLNLIANINMLLRNEKNKSPKKIHLENILAVLKLQNQKDELVNFYDAIKAVYKTASGYEGKLAQLEKELMSLKVPGLDAKGIKAALQEAKQEQLTPSTARPAGVQEKAAGEPLPAGAQTVVTLPPKQVPDPTPIVAPISGVTLPPTPPPKTTPVAGKDDVKGPLPELPKEDRQKPPPPLVPPPTIPKAQTTTIVTPTTIVAPLSSVSPGPVPTTQAPSQSAQLSKPDVKITIDLKGNKQEMVNSLDMLDSSKGGGKPENIGLSDADWIVVKRGKQRQGRPERETKEDILGVGDRLSNYLSGRREFLIKDKNSKQTVFKVIVTADGISIKPSKGRILTDDQLKKMNDLATKLNVVAGQSPRIHTDNVKKMTSLMEMGIYEIGNNERKVIAVDREKIKEKAKESIESTYNIKFKEEHKVSISAALTPERRRAGFEQAIKNGVIPVLFNKEITPGHQNQGEYNSVSKVIRINTDDPLVAIKQYESALAAGFEPAFEGKAIEGVRKYVNEALARNPLHEKQIVVSGPIVGGIINGSHVLNRVLHAAKTGLIVQVEPQALKALKEHVATLDSNKGVHELKDTPDPAIVIRNLAALGILVALPTDSKKATALVKQIQQSQQSQRALGRDILPFMNSGNPGRDVAALKQYLDNGISVSVTATDNILDHIAKKDPENPLQINLDKLPPDQQKSKAIELATLGIASTISPPGLSEEPIQITSKNQKHAIKIFGQMLNQGFKPSFDTATNNKVKEFTSALKETGSIEIKLQSKDPKILFNQIKQCMLLGFVPKPQLTTKENEKLQQYIKEFAKQNPGKESQVEIGGNNPSAILANMMMAQTLGVSLTCTDEAKMITNKKPVPLWPVMKGAGKEAEIDIEKSLLRADNIAKQGFKVEISHPQIGERYEKSVNVKRKEKFQGELNDKTFLFFESAKAKNAKRELKQDEQFLEFFKGLDPTLKAAIAAPFTPPQHFAPPGLTQSPAVPQSTAGVRPPVVMSKPIVPEQKIFIPPNATDNAKAAIEKFTHMRHEAEDKITYGFKNTPETREIRNQSTDIVDYLLRTLKDAERTKLPPEDIDKALLTYLRAVKDTSPEVKKAATDLVKRMEDPSASAGHAMKTKIT